MAFTQSLAEFVVLVIEFGFNLSATREIARNRQSKAACGEIMAGVLGSQFILAACGLLGAFLISRAIPVLRNNPKLLAAGCFYAIAQGFIPLWFFQGLERMRLAATLEIFGRIVGLCSIFLLVRSSKDIWVALLIQGIAPAVTTIIGLTMAYRYIPCCMPTWSSIQSAMARGWRMFVFQERRESLRRWERFPLGLFVSPVQVGYFAAAEKISRAAFGLLNPIREALYPRLSNMWNRSPKDALRLARIGATVMMSGGVLLAAGVFLFAPVLIRLLMGQAFTPAVTVLRILSVLPVLLAVTQSAGTQWLIPLGRDADVNRVILQAGALNVVLAVVLAPRFAQTGMAWGVVCAEMFVTCSLIRVVRRSRSQFIRTAEQASLQELAQVGEFTS